MQASPPSIRKKMAARWCFRNPVIKAITPKRATNKARLRCTRSSAGSKCENTAENEIRTGVSTQWTTHSDEVQIPSLSAHWRGVIVEIEAKEDIRFQILRIS